MQTAEEAVASWQLLAAASPELFLASYAESLEILARRLDEAGRPREAAGATREAIARFRLLAAAEEDEYLPLLAQSLNNLSAELNRLGEYGEAVAASREATELYRQLEASRPGEFLAELAESLDNLGGDLGSLGRHTEALEATWEALEMCRTLVGKQPEAFSSDLAMKLHNLACCPADLDRHGEALTMVQEAVEIRRRLAQTDGSHLPALANSLRIMSEQLISLRQGEKALLSLRESVGIQRSLALDGPGNALALRAKGLDMLRDLLQQHGLDREALDIDRELVALLRRLADVQPDPYEVALSAALAALAGDLERCGESQEACLHAREAVDRLITYAKDDRARVNEVVGAAVSTLLSCSRAAKDSDKEAYAQRILMTLQRCIDD